MKTTSSVLKRRIADDVAAALARWPEVSGVAVFGSVARGSASGSSDIDILVLLDGASMRATDVLGLLPEHLRRDDVSLSLFTSTSLHQYLHRWSRFAVHLRDEATVLYDTDQSLAELLAEEIPVSVDHELSAQREHLEHFEHLDRFGGRMLFPLSHLYRIGRTVVFAHLAQRGQFRFDRVDAFRTLRRSEPTLAHEIDVIAALEPFYDRVRSSDPTVALPFDPVGVDAESRAREAHHAVASLLATSGAGNARA